jgi:S1-C subfamily serine protease
MDTPSSSRGSGAPLPRITAHVAFLALLVGVLPGCGGNSGKTASKLDTSTTPTTPAPQSATTLQQQFIQVVKTVSPKVVQISTPGGLGSGVIYDTKGNIVTNAHVVGDFREFTVTLAGGAQHPAKLVGSYPQGDLAVVRLTNTKPAPAIFADSSKIQVGEFAFAIGNPLGLRSSVTEGIVSSVGRTVLEGPGVTIPSAVQTSAPINPGNSGGALVDINGRVIGIPTLAALNPEFGAQAPGIGFAIPSNTARDVANQLISTGRVAQAQGGYLGVEVTTIVGGGVLVRRVAAGGPAAKAGIRPGDVIVAMAGQPTATADDLHSVLGTLKPGQKVDVDLLQQGSRQATVSVTLGKRPNG